MTWLLRLLLLPLLGLPVLVVAAPPATACSCVRPGSVAQASAEADAVALVTLTDSVDAAEGQISVRGEVERVYKGTVAQEIIVSTGEQESACGVPGIARGGSWILYRYGDEFGVGLCSKSGRATASDVAAVERVLGPGRAAVVESPVSERGAAPSEDDGDPALPWVLAGGVALVLLAGVGVVRSRHA